DPSVKLPDTVDVLFGEGNSGKVAVDWDVVDLSGLVTVGQTVTVQGTLQNGSAQKALATFTAVSASDVTDFSLVADKTELADGESTNISIVGINDAVI